MLVKKSAQSGKSEKSSTLDFAKSNKLWLHKLELTCMNYLFSGKASVKHLITTEDIGSPRLEMKNETHISKEFPY